MKNILCIALNFFLINILLASNIDTLPEFHLQKEEFKAHLYYIASDEMQGRKTGSKENDLAAEYIAQQFEKYGLKQADSLNSWFQGVPFNKVIPAESGSMEFGGETYRLGDKLILTNGAIIDLTAEVVFAGHGWVDKKTNLNDYEDLDVEGKIVLVLPGNPETSHPFSAFELSPKKRAIAAEKGAVALIELYRLNFPWIYFKNFMGKERMELAQSEELGINIISGWIKETSKDKIVALKNGKKMEAHIHSTGVFNEKIFSNNVIGIIEGTDDSLKSEYVILTAHYDHVGTESSAIPKEDTIFNGARDNGMGVAALLGAAKSLGEKPPKRSVVFAAVTAEEMGMLGSQYYVNHPVVPLKQTIFNLNNDGGGYNSTQHIAIIGFGRTGTDEEIKKSGKFVGLKIAANPMPNENLFDRSDNVSFAQRGIPCLDFAPGALSFDDEVLKYYHQTADNPESVDYDYLLKFVKAYAHAARLIANKAVRPKWTEGDKYEALGKSLYGLK